MGFHKSIGYRFTGNIESLNVIEDVVTQYILLDRSYSMEGDKLKGALLGIKEFIKINKNTFVYTFHNNNTLKLVKNLDTIYAQGITGLAENGNRLIDIIKLTDKESILTIFTDGGDNDSNFSDRETFSKSIKNSNNDDSLLTITFIGTSDDSLVMKTKFGVSGGNILVHDNTPKGIMDILAEALVKTNQFTSLSKEERKLSRKSIYID